MAAVRTTREGTARQGSETLPCIIGTPLKGEKISRRSFDGKEEFAVFPGDLPEDPEILLKSDSKGRSDPLVHFVRFRPPVLGP